MMTISSLPTFDQLPIDPKYPPQTAWGVWGEHDNLGTLNLLTEERVANAAKCIRRGAVFPLNWKLESPNPGLFGRVQAKHNVTPLSVVTDLMFDETYDNFNTQYSSQWDGLRHVGHLPTGQFYNGVKITELTRGNKESNDRLAIHHMARRGIAGRAVLLDYGRWAAKYIPDFNALERIEISIQDLDMVAEAQGVKFEVGDILLVRTGWMEAYEQYSGEKIEENPSCCGVKACDETFKWIWNHHFSAVASDNFSFEAYPVTDWAKSCHTFLIPGIGCPIGELFELDKLAEDSANDGVYTFFFTSAPLNKENGIASPPNAMCIK